MVKFVRWGSEGTQAGSESTQGTEGSEESNHGTEGCQDLGARILWPLLEHTFQLF